MNCQTVSVKVVFAQVFTIQLDINGDKEANQERVLDHAAYLLETSPTEGKIVSCPDYPELVD